MADEIHRLATLLPYFVTIRSFVALAAATTGHADMSSSRMERILSVDPGSMFIGSTAFAADDKTNYTDACATPLFAFSASPAAS